MEDLMEQMAAVEHERWSKWIKYQFGKCVRDANGSLIVPHDLVERWQRQAATPYEALSEKEKETDREEVRTILKTLHGQVNLLRHEMSMLDLKL